MPGTLNESQPVPTLALALLEIRLVLVWLNLIFGQWCPTHIIM